MLTSPSSAYYITTSPWMLSLCGELNAILLASEEGLSTERLILKQRLHLDGDLLFTEVRHFSSRVGTSSRDRCFAALFPRSHKGTPRPALARRYVCDISD